MKKLLFLLVFLVILSCNSLGIQGEMVQNAVQKEPEIFYVYIERDFSRQDKQDIESAIEKWNFVLNHQLKIQVVSDSFEGKEEVFRNAKKNHSWIISRVSINDSRIPGTLPFEECVKTIGCRTTFAWCDLVSGNFMFIARDRFTQDDLTPLTLHEVGHLLGLYHSDEETALMNKDFNIFNYRCIDREATEKVAKIYDLDSAKMEYCLAK